MQKLDRDFVNPCSGRLVVMGFALLAACSADNSTPTDTGSSPDARMSAVDSAMDSRASSDPDVALPDAP